MAREKSSLEELLDLFLVTLPEKVTMAADALFRAIAEGITPFLALLIAVTLAFYLLNSAFRRSFSMDGLLYFVTRSALIFSLVAGGLLWTKYTYPFLADFGQNMGIMIYNAFADDRITDEGSFTDIFYRFIKKVNETATKLTDQIEDHTIPSANEITGLLLEIMVKFFAYVMVAISVVILVICLCFMALFLAISPLFTVWLYLGATQSLFQGWLKGIVTILTTQILVFAALGLVIAATTTFGDSSAAAADHSLRAEDRDKQLVEQLMNLTLLSIVGIGMLIPVPKIANMIAGSGISLGESFIRHAVTNPGLAAARAGGQATGGALRGLATMLRGSDPAGQAAKARNAAATEARGSTSQARAAKILRGSQ